MSKTDTKYMPHVDGLRCVAVMAVLLFHFGVPGMGGGYVGVDIFFVISGYLITSIIINEVLGTGGFDFRSFYVRRIRRILPALITTLIVTTIFALISLTPTDLVAYGRSLLASAISLSNLLFWSESGYFDAAAQTKPLLHTWSLSVEEQFYLIWPAFLYFCYRGFGKRGLFWGIAGAGLASFAANYLLVAARDVDFRSDLFFLPHYRVFEFAIGALGYFLVKRLPSSRPLHEAMMVLGMGLMIYSIIVLKEGDVFPYVNAIAPCLGALLVIAARDSTGARLLLGNRVAVWFGKISYSLYLTHWPVVVFVGQYMLAASWGMRFAAMASLSLVTAIGLHYLIEVRFRYAKPSGRAGVPARRILVAAMLCCVVGASFFLSDGMTWRYRYFIPGAMAHERSGEMVATSSGKVPSPSEMKHDESEPFKPLGAAEIEAGKARRFEALAGACNISSLEDPVACAVDRPVQVLIFGNSHEPDAFNAFDEIYGKDPRVNLISFGTVNDCEVVLGDALYSSPTTQLACDKRFSTLNSDRFLQALDVVVYNTHQGFDPVARDLWRVLEILKKRNPSIKIMAIGSYLQTATECASLYNRYGTYDACRAPEAVNYFNPDERVNTTVPQVKTLDYVCVSKYELLCKEQKLQGCLVYANGEPAFYDQHHLSRGFARYLGQKLAEQRAAELIELGLPDPAKLN